MVFAGEVFTQNESLLGRCVFIGGCNLYPSLTIVYLMHKLFNATTSKHIKVNDKI